MTPHAYDQRQISEIRHDLLGTSRDDIDVIAALVVLCERIDDLERQIVELKN